MNHFYFQGLFIVFLLVSGLSNAQAKGQGIIEAGSPARTIGQHTSLAAGLPGGNAGCSQFF